jgi:predicted phage tail protein
MIEVKYIPNRLEKAGILSKQVRFKKGSSLQYYINASDLLPKIVNQEDMNIICMGKTVETPKKFRPKNQDQIIITPKIKDPVSIFTAIYAFVTSAAFQTAIFALSVGYSIYQAVTAKSRLPNFGDGYGIDEGSPTYGWDGISQTRNEGIAVPVVYGEHRVGGNVINEYIRTNGDKNYLHSLTALCEGEIESVSDVEVNGNPIANFDAVQTTVKTGTNAQTSIPNFEDLHNLQTVNVELTQNNAHVYTTVDDDVEAFEIHLQIPTGLFAQNPDNGQINAWAITYLVEYKVHTDVSYTSLGSTTISEKSRSAIRRIFRKDGLTPAQYDIRVTKTSADGDFDNNGDLYFDKVDEIKTDNLSYPNTALHAVEILATEQLQGQAPNITVVVKGKKVSCPAVLNGVTPVAWEDYYWDPTYNSGAGAYRLLSDDTVLTWNGSTFADAYCANPIWCLKDLLVNTRYGLGEFIDASLIDLTLFIEMSQYCEEAVDDGAGNNEKRYRMDVVLDSFTASLDLISQLTATFDAFPFYSEGSIKFRIDKPETVTQVFGMGNIIQGTFSQSWKSIKDIPNVIEVTFNDKEKNYEQDTVAFMDEDVINDSTQQRRKQQLRIFTTRISQALRIARYSLKVAKYIDRIVTFRAGIDAVACQVGDRIDISHDVPQWGFSGRLSDEEHTVSKVFLDKDVTIAAGKTYEIQIRHGADVIETREVTNTPETTNELDITPPLSAIPNHLDVYAFGEENIQSKPFRVISLERMNSDEVEIRAIEYDENVYDDTAIDLPEDNYSALGTDIPLVTNLDTTERAVDLPDGTTISVIDVYWTKPDDTALVNKFRGVKIYMSDDNGNSWTYQGYSEGIKFTINDNLDAATYYIKAVTVCWNGIEDTISNAPQDIITLTGAGKTPDIVANFQYTWGDKLTLVWSPNTELSLAGYEIRTDDANWGVDDADLVYRGLATKIVLEPDARTLGTYYIRAYNRSGTYSTTSASVSPADPTPTEPTNLGVDVLFNVARLYWDDVGDVSIKYYEVWESQTNAWAGEETLYGKVSGREIHLEGNRAKGGTVNAADATTLQSDDLIGLTDDQFNKDRITITTGVDEGDEVEITDFDGDTGTITVAGWDTTPEAGDLFQIFDRVWIKVRGYDNYGEGAFSGAQLVQFEGIDADSVEDKIITARKIYVECLSALSANLGCITAGTVQGATFQTGSGGARTVMDSCMFRSYDANCCVMFEVFNGCICASSLKLIDPNCTDCYSYLSAGQWYFHDKLCNINPYVKRISSGSACTGAVICLCGWCVAPNVMVGIRSLDSFNASYPSQSQQWDVYSTAPAFYCNSATDYGHCFAVHACLLLSASTGATCTPDIAFDQSQVTAANVCKVCFRLRFQNWCNAACANYYYGTVCYQICYKLCTTGTWCACNYTSVQPHGSLGQMQTTYDEYQTINFATNGTWNLMGHVVSVGWTNSGFASGSSVNCCCSRALTGGTRTTSFTCCIPWSGYCINQTVGDGTTYAFAGSNPANIYYTCVSYTWCSYGAGLAVGACKFGASNYGCARASGSLCAPASSCSLDSRSSPWACVCAGTEFVCCVPSACTFTASGSAVLSNANQSNLCLGASVSWSVNATGASGYAAACGAASVCLVSATLIQCYTVCTGSAGCCSYRRFYQFTETFGTQTILDPNGCLNWIAVGFF